jgi:hypothetical protein
VSKLVSATGVSSVFGGAVMFGSEPLRWTAVIIVGVVILLAGFVVVVRIVGRTNWVTNAAEVMELVVLQERRPPAAMKKKRKKRKKKKKKKRSPRS